jgi:hypothetical protein
MLESVRGKDNFWRLRYYGSRSGGSAYAKHDDGTVMVFDTKKTCEAARRIIESGMTNIVVKESDHYVGRHSLW